MAAAAAAAAGGEEVAPLGPPLGPRAAGLEPEAADPASFSPGAGVNWAAFAERIDGAAAALDPTSEVPLWAELADAVLPLSLTNHELLRPRVELASGVLAVVHKTAKRVVLWDLARATVPPLSGAAAVEFEEHIKAEYGGYDDEQVRVAKLAPLGLLAELPCINARGCAFVDQPMPGHSFRLAVVTKSDHNSNRFVAVYRMQTDLLGAADVEAAEAMAAKIAEERRVGEKDGDGNLVFDPEEVPPKHEWSFQPAVREFTMQAGGEELDCPQQIGFLPRARDATEGGPGAAAEGEEAEKEGPGERDLLLVVAEGGANRVTLVDFATGKRLSELPVRTAKASWPWGLDIDHRRRLIIAGCDSHLVTCQDAGFAGGDAKLKVVHCDTKSSLNECRTTGSVSFDSAGNRVVVESSTTLAVFPPCWNDDQRDPETGAYPMSTPGQRLEPICRIRLNDAAAGGDKWGTDIHSTALDEARGLLYVATKRRILAFRIGAGSRTKAARA